MANNQPKKKKRQYPNLLKKINHAQKKKKKSNLVKPIKEKKKNKKPDAQENIAKKK